MTGFRLCALTVLFSTSCIFGSSDPPANTGDTGNTPDTGLPVSDMGPGGVDQGERPDTDAPSPDLGVDMTVVSPDLGPPDFGTPTQVNCGQPGDVIRPNLYPGVDILDGAVVRGDLSFKAFESPAGDPSVVLGHRTTDAAHINVFEVDGQSVVQRTGPPVPDLMSPADIAVGNRGMLGNFDAAVPHSSCGAPVPGYLWLLREGGALEIGDPVTCPSPIWATEFAGGYRPFTGSTNGSHRAVFFEANGNQVDIVSLSSPYTVDDREFSRAEVEMNGGWIESSAGDLLVFADEQGQLHGWDSRGGRGPVELGISSERRHFGMAALGGDNYVVARRVDSGTVTVGTYTWRRALNRFDLQQEVDNLQATPQAVDVATFEGGFAVFIQDGTSQWSVMTYVPGGGGAEFGCQFDFNFSASISVTDVELVAYRDGSDLQVLAAVLFESGNFQYINVEGPRWPDYFQ